MNVLVLRNNVVEFIGFESFDDNENIIVRILADKLVINSGDIKTASGKISIRLIGKKSSNPELHDLFSYCCKELPTTFVS